MGHDRRPHASTHHPQHAEREAVDEGKRNARGPRREPVDVEKPKGETLDADRYCRRDDALRCVEDNEAVSDLLGERVADHEQNCTRNEEQHRNVGNRLCGLRGGLAKSCSGGRPDREGYTRRHHDEDGEPPRSGAGPARRDPARLRSQLREATAERPKPGHRKPDREWSRKQPVNQETSKEQSNTERRRDLMSHRKPQATGGESESEYSKRWVEDHKRSEQRSGDRKPVCCL